MRASIADRMNAAGPTRGFDYLRLFLALGVVAWHSIYVSGDAQVQNIVLNSWIGPLKALLLPMFFSLSGFLVAGSMERARSLEGFATLRVLRIAPALAVEVLLSVILLGAVLTELPLGEYFTSPTLRSYLLNMCGDIHYHLPGVFLNNPVHATVNLSLWTVPFELQCYLFLIVLSGLGFFKRKPVFLCVGVSLNLGLWLAYFIFRAHGPASAASMTMPGPGLVISFLAGITIYLYRREIPLRAELAVLAFILAYGLLHEPRFMVLAIFPAAYLTIWAGLTNPPSSLIVRSGDYSYGIYVFAFPIQQALAMNPTLRLWYFNMPAAFVLSFLYATFSWHVVEKPVLGKKKPAVAFVEALGARLRRRLWPAAPASSSL